MFVKLCSSSNIASDHWQADPIQYLGPFRQVFREVAIEADHDFEYGWVFVYTYIQVCIYDLHLNFKNCIFHSFEWCTSEKSLIFRINHYFPPAYTFWILSNNESDIYFQFPVSLCMITLPIGFIIYGPIQFINDCFNIKLHNCLKL